MRARGSMRSRRQLVPLMPPDPRCLFHHTRTDPLSHLCHKFWSDARGSNPKSVTVALRFGSRGLSRTAPAAVAQAISSRSRPRTRSINRPGKRRRPLRRSAFQHGPGGARIRQTGIRPMPFLDAPDANSRLGSIGHLWNARNRLGGASGCGVSDPRARADSIENGRAFRATIICYCCENATMLPRC